MRQTKHEQSLIQHKIITRGVIDVKELKQITKLKQSLEVTCSANFLIGTSKEKTNFKTFKSIRGILDW